MKFKLALLIILAIFVAHAVSLNFIQDDAFISYRYVRNFLNGHGLVFNPGERVEGYTNFLWVLLLAFVARLGLNIILASKILGLFSGCAALILLYALSRLLLLRAFSPGTPAGDDSGTHRAPGKRPPRYEHAFALIPPFLLACNGAFAYWSVSGLETVLFVMAVLLSVYVYFTNEKLIIICSALASLIRPEGVLVFAILILHKLLIQKDGLRSCLLYISGFALLLLPYLIFKISYYGDLLPSPFYAKTGLSWGYVRSGLAYFWLFLSHYGLWGALFLLPMVLWRGLGTGGKLIPLLVCGYTLYIIIVGGDVLQAHRFFLPVLPFLYFLVAAALFKLNHILMKRTIRRAIPIFAVLALSLLTFMLPRHWLLNVRRSEIGLYIEMVRYAQNLRQVFGEHFTLAASTVGAISYYSDARVIDMLGLTDPFIAKHPERHPGISSPWREKNYNTQYLLSRDPDAILFSTGAKPSAPAERALFLNSKFRNNYYPYYFPEGDRLSIFYKRKGEYPYPNHVFPDARFANLYNEALNLENNEQLSSAVSLFKELLEVGPEDFAWAHDHIAYCYFLLNNRHKAKEHAFKAIEFDDYCMLSHYVLVGAFLAEKDTAAAERERDKILLYNPEFIW